MYSGTVSVGERRFKVIRVCREEHMTDELKEAIKQSNILINVVLSDGKGNLLFCHEIKDVEFTDVTNE